MDFVRAKAERAREAALKLARASDATRAAAVIALANALERRRDAILHANAEDVAAAQREALAPPLLARLKLTPEKLALTLAGVRQVAALPDPVGRTLRATLLDDGLRLSQVSAPLGVVACVFESRPDAAIQIPALTLRSGNAVLLKGGAEAERTNRAIVDAIRAAIEAAGIPKDAVQLLEGRAEANALLTHDDLVDLVIPRGSAAFVRHVKAATRIPVLGHAEGVCHVYIDASADPRRALAIALDAKTDNPSACNAAECILVHEDAGAIREALLDALRKAGVEVREGEGAYGREWGDMTVSLATVKGVEDAIAFINRHGSKHTDAIVTQDAEAARRFVAGVDSAGVFVNASTRFADGFRYGLGAEVGVSTSKIHARGPVGLEGLTTTKWVLVGEGHTAAPYQGAHPRPFRHEPLPPDDPLG